MFAPINKSDKCQTSKGKKKEMTSLGSPEKTKPIFIWTSEHQMAFDRLKTALTTAPVLGYPDLITNLF